MHPTYTLGRVLCFASLLDSIPAVQFNPKNLSRLPLAKMKILLQKDGAARTEVEVDVVVDLDVEIGVPGGDGGGEVDPGLGGQLVVALGVVQPQEVPGLRLLRVQRAVQRPAARRAAVPDHEPDHDPLLRLQLPQLLPCAAVTSSRVSG